MASSGSAGRRRAASRGDSRTGPLRHSSLRHGARTTNTVWLPVTAAAGVLLLLLWYALSQEPTADNAASGKPAASALAAPEGEAAPSPLPTVPPPPTSGCQTGNRLPAGITTETITVDGVERRYLLAIPQGGDTSGPLPLVLAFHRNGQTAEQLEEYTQIATEGTKAGFAVATLVGEKDRWNFTRSSSVGPDDVLFAGMVLNDLTGRTCLDANRVFATGFSDGADMALATVCALPSRFAAVVAVAASVLPGSCDKPAASLLEIHGTEDQIAPYNGGGQPRPAPYEGVVAQPVEERVSRYAAALGCGTDRIREQDLAEVTRTAWTACPSGKDVGILAMQGGGHTWPGAAERPELGPTISRLSGTVVALAFFRGHPADGAATGSGGGSGGRSGDGGGTDGTGGADAGGENGGDGGGQPAPSATPAPTPTATATTDPGSGESDSDQSDSDQSDGGRDDSDQGRTDPGEGGGNGPQ